MWLLLLLFFVRVGRFERNEIAKMLVRIFHLFYNPNILSD